MNAQSDSSAPFGPYRQMLEQVQPVGLAGRVSGVRGLTASVSDFPVPVGAACRIGRCHGEIDARVIGFEGDQTLVMPLGPTTGICRGDRVVCTSTEETVGVGSSLLGRVLDGLGRPIDGLGELHVEARVPLWPPPISPMRRRRVKEALATGVRAIDAMLTVGKGQRMGIFSGSGVGKSVLLGMIARYTRADVNVIALVGERGREVREFIERDLGPEGLKRSVVVVSTGNEPPLARVHAGAVATAVAEYFRDRGADVLLLLDSLTRLATAQRQIGLVAGEPPTTRGYTPSVFNLLPELLERSGCTAGGSITGFYTVLVDADDGGDPIADAARSVTDGHIWLSRDLANRGVYPAVDVLQSVSRVMLDVASPEHHAAAAEIRRLLALHAEVEELVNVGAYQSGASEQTDVAIKAMPLIRAFLSQRVDEASDMPGALEGARKLLAEVRAIARPQPPRLMGRPVRAAAAQREA
jgi:FliI/YscN family ATPase